MMTQPAGPLSLSSANFDAYLQLAYIRDAKSNIRAPAEIAGPAVAHLRRITS